MTTPRGPRSSVIRPRMKIRGPADFILAVPYLLGFHPEQSLVVVGLTDGQVAVTARVDLADVVAEHGGDVLHGTLAAMAEGGAEHYVGLVFDDRAVPAGRTARRGDLPWVGLADAFAYEVDELDLGLDEIMLISGGRWWSYVCGEASCCPPEGSPVDDVGSVVPATAAFAGMVALPDRAALAGLLAPDPVDVRAALLADVQVAEAALRADPGELPMIRRAVFAAARHATPPGEARGGPGVGPEVELDRDQLVRFGAGLRLIELRDAAWLTVDERRIDGRELWRALGRQLPDPYAAAPMFLFGWASWRAGDGALANVAADRALESDPTYTAGDLLLAALTRGIDPRRMPSLRERTA